MNIRKLVVGTIAVAILLASTVPTLAVKLNGPSAENGLTHPGAASQLYLYEKDPSTWAPVEGGALGKMTFSDTKFVFNGNGLMPNTEYTLIRYTDPWPGTPVVCLADGTTNAGGNINLSGEMLAGGAKVWLVLSSDVNCTTQMMTGWNPTEYLFEQNLIP